MSKDMLLITTSIGKGALAVVDYLGIVIGEAIIYKPGAGNLSCLSDKSSKLLEKARESAMREMEEKAEKMDANAIVGIDLNYEVVDSKELFIVTVSGTAVKLING